MDITNRKIYMFRCHIDPMIGPKPRLAFLTKDLQAQVEIASDSQGPMGVYVKLADGIEHLVPFSNIQSIRLDPLEANVTNLEERRKPGRPVGS